MSEPKKHNSLSWVIPRPQEVIAHLPLQYQWEFTRRHAYYVMFWAPSEMHVLNQLSDEPIDDFVSEISKIILAQIGVSSPTIPPDREWNDIAPGDEWSPWTSGALGRIGLRGLASALVTTQSKDTLKSLSLLLWDASQLSESDITGQYRLLRRITEGDYPGFDSLLPKLIVSINPASSEAAIKSAIKTIVRDYRDESGMPSTRIRADKFDEYLRIWDLREGWNGGTYEGSKASKLEQIAVETGKNVSTIRDHYKAAFRLITGQEYSPEIYYQVLRYFQILGLIGSSDGPKPRRAGRTKSVAGVNESELSVDANTLANVAARANGILDEDDNRIIIEAIHSDKSTADIVAEFDLEPHVFGLIEDFRERLSESP